jgi:hypothetical protein
MLMWLVSRDVWFQYGQDNSYHDWGFLSPFSQMITLVRQYHFHPQSLQFFTSPVNTTWQTGSFLKINGSGPWTASYPVGTG